MFCIANLKNDIKVCYPTLSIMVPLEDNTLVKKNVLVLDEEDKNILGM